MAKLNKIERLKVELKPYDFLDRIDMLDMDNLSEDDRFYLRNFGIYNHKLSPHKFMLRVRIVAGRVDSDILEYISLVAYRYHLRITITMRSQLELHDLSSSNILIVYRELQSRGITTWQTLSDNIRNITTNPLDGVALSSRMDLYPIIEEMESLFLSNPSYFGMLPRKFNVSISATTEGSFSFFSSDLYFALAYRDGVLGFNIYIGGKNSATAKSVDIFVQPDSVVEIFEAILKAYVEYGLRSTRSKTRLYHLLQEIGVDRFREYISLSYNSLLQSSGELEMKKRAFDRFEKLIDGRYAYRYESRYGELDPKELLDISKYCSKEHLSIRLGVDKNIYIIGLERRSIPFESQTSSANISLCVGSRYCSLSLFDMKDELSYLPIDRIERLGISVGFSGCLKGCGRHHHVDIGLVGLRTAIYGDTQKSIRLYLGGEYSRGRAVARLLFMAIPLYAIGSMIDTILDEYEESNYSDFEDFSRSVLNNHSKDFLVLWFLAKLYYGTQKRLKPIVSQASIEEEALMISTISEDIDIADGSDETIFYKSIQSISQKLWGR